jgi:NADH dehydrogenase [ubiquinone] 1 alpha subcomplex assembly factor 7
MTPLKKILIEEISANGPMLLADYIARVLGDPDHGYYMQRRPFGTQNKDGGDFITAPEVSQMFGELIGTWLADLWHRMGQPSDFCLVELGPGRGTLMADILRAANVLPDFAKAAQVHFVETSPALRAAQKQVVPQAVWHNDISTLPQAPTLLIANEFFDALPVQPYRKQGDDWAPIIVTADGDNLALVDGDTTQAPFSEALTACLPDTINDGDIVESAAAVESAMHNLAQHIATHGGAALLIDYGHAKPACGDSFQAMRGHGYVDPLAEPGLADLTAHVNFPLLAHIAEATGLTAAPIIEQGLFLEALGLSLRSQQLIQLSPDCEADIESERHRLAAPQEMGSLFKVLAVAHANMPPLAGFPEV